MQFRGKQWDSKKEESVKIDLNSLEINPRNSVLNFEEAKYLLPARQNAKNMMFPGNLQAQAGCVAPVSEVSSR